MDNSNMNESFFNVGIPYRDITWYDIEGQPFGIASQFNAIIFDDANNIVDVTGAMAVGGNFNSRRGISFAYGRYANESGIGYTPDLVRFMVGGNVSIAGPLVVSGHVVAGGNFRVAKGSTYFIGSNGTRTQEQELANLYQANGGSRYWRPSNKGNYYVISSYDVPRFIPSGRIGADLALFFQNARESITRYKDCIDNLPANGQVIDNGYEWILRGNDERQNVFLIDVSPNGRLNKGIRAEVPEGSLIIVKLRTGNNAYLQYGIYGSKDQANRTLYVFEDADNIYMQKSSDIWGSILAPQASFTAHQTGGHISGNIAFRAFTVDANSGFEFHHYPFIGGVICGTPVTIQPEQPQIMPIEESIPCPTCPTCPEQVVCPAPVPCPEQEACPIPQPCPTCPKQEACPIPQPCPTCPVQEACPVPAPCPTCPVQEAFPMERACPVCPICPECPTPEACPTCPEQMECPVPEQCPECPVPKPCPICPKCPVPRPCPECPVCTECPTCSECPECPEQTLYREYVFFPIQTECPEQKPCPECLIIPGIIYGCVWGCSCSKIHGWYVKLYKLCNDYKTELYCKEIACCGCFEFEVPYHGCYLLEICPINCNKKTCKCKPVISFKNIGVSNLIIE